jgi:uncharacterized protein YgiM (DUF1202 family)
MKNFLKPILEKIKRIFKNLFFKHGVFWGVVPFLFVLFLFLGPVVKIIHKDLNSTQMYIISESLNIRSDKSKDAYVIGTYKYGTQVNVYSIYQNKWAEVSIGKKKGYMSVEYLVSPETFYLIDGMFGNKIAKENITQTAYKKAIATYLSENGYISDMPDDIKRQLYGRKAKHMQVWQIFGLPSSSLYNSFAYGDFNGDRKTDAAFVIRNKDTEKTKLIILNINTLSTHKFGNLLYSMDLPENWYYIKLAPRGTKYKIGGKNQVLPIDGLLIGSNRAPGLKDPVNLLLFDGEKFQLYLQ